MLVTTVEQLSQFLAAIAGNFPIIIDTETSGLRMFDRENPARMCGIAVGPLDEDKQWYLSYRHADSENLPLWTLPIVADALAGRQWIAHNAGFDLRILACDGFELPPSILDTRTLAKYYNEELGKYGLKELATRFLGPEAAAADKLLRDTLRSRKLTKGDICKLPAEIVAPYALDDIRLPRQLYNLFMPEIVRWRQEDPFASSCRARRVLTKMELRGIKIDRAEMQRQMEQIGPRLAAITARIREMAGFDINLNSPKQLKEWLKLPKTAALFLQDIQAKEPREDVRLLLEYRSLFKAESSFFRPLMAWADVHDRIHTSYDESGARTGRYSSSEPNCQQFSRNQKDRAYSVRDCLIARDGHFLLEMDYNTVEPRIAAHFSGDETMKAAFIHKHDFHAAMARSMLRKDKVSDAERTNAKSLGLGILYGMGAYKSAVKCALRHDRLPNGEWKPHHEDVWAFVNEQLVQLPCSVASAEYCTHAGKAYITKFYEGLPNLKPFMDMVKGKARDHKYVRNPLSKRIRRFTVANPHKAPNSIIQGTAAHILERAMVRLDADFCNPGDPQMLLTVHDSLVFEVPFGDRAWEAVAHIKHVMETTTTLSIPLTVEAKIGLSLGNLGKVEI